MTLLASEADKARMAPADRFAILARGSNREKPTSMPAHSAVGNLVRDKGESDDILF